jgi:hypothetical protein
MGVLFYEILALRQFSSEYVRRVKTRNFGFFKEYPTGFTLLNVYNP